MVFPPCDVDALLAAPAARRASDAKYVLSVGQFREKDQRSCARVGGDEEACVRGR